MTNKKQIVRLLCGALLMAGSLQSCEKEILTGQPAWLGNSIYERLEEGIEVDGEKKSFQYTLQLIDDLNLTDVLSKTGSKTLFVASDDVYDEWFKTNSWGVRSYEQLSYKQKSLLLNNSMINNAYLLELMSNVSGNPPLEGLCMRRPTAAGIHDTVPVMTIDEMPVNPMLKTKLDAWAPLREAGNPIRIYKDTKTAPMIHFLPEFMRKNHITAEDLYILSNHESNSTEDAWINGKKVISKEQTCKNGYIYVVDGVIEVNRNMAEIISQEPEMHEWWNMLKRFSVPVKASASIQQDYNRLYNNTDTVYELGFYHGAISVDASGTKRWTSFCNQDPINMTPANRIVTATLKYNPGLNQYMWNNASGYDLHYDAGAMIVPTNDAVLRWWNTAGKGLQEEYGSLDQVPALVISKLLNVNMLLSFVNSVPSKFHTILDDSKMELGITPSDVVACYMGCNGVIYLVDKVFPPSEYRSVVYPALAHPSTMGVIYYAIDTYEYGPFLNSMESYFSLVLPHNTAEGSDGKSKVFRYLDPCTYGQEKQTLWEFYYAEGDDDEVGVKANRYRVSVDETTGAITYLEKINSSISESLIRNRLADLVNNLIVVGDIEDGNEYHKTRAGSVLRVTGSGSSLKIQGGYELERDMYIDVAEVYDLRETGNGQSYGVEGCAPQTASKSVYEVLKATADKGGNSLFYKLLAEDDADNEAFLAIKSGSYSCANDGNNNRNIRLFDNYNYSVYVPSDAAIQAMIDAHQLPTWDDFHALDEAVEQEDEYAKQCQDSIKKIIRDFVRYHIQDNSVFIGMGNVDGVRYETCKLNPTNGRFFALEVTANSSDLSIKDQLGHVRKVVKANGLYNRACREYWLSGLSTSDSRQISSSSNAVVHEIDGVLLYSADQLTDWNTRLPEHK